MHFLCDNSVFYSSIRCYFCSSNCYPLIQAGEVGFAVDVVLQELLGGCPTSGKPCE